MFYLGSGGKLKSYHMLCNGLLYVCYMLLVCYMLCNDLLCVTWEYDLKKPVFFLYF